MKGIIVGTGNSGKPKNILEIENDILRKKIDNLEKQLAIQSVSNALPNDVKCILIESEYRLQQAIDIFNGTTNLDSTGEDKYSNMVNCANKINEYLKGNDC